MKVVVFLHEEEIGGSQRYNHQSEVEVMVDGKPDKAGCNQNLSFRPYRIVEEILIR